MPLLQRTSKVHDSFSSVCHAVLSALMLRCAVPCYTADVPQAESFFSEAERAAAASAAYAKHEAALARRVAQLPRPVMAARSDNSITITIDKRGQVSDDRMAVSAAATAC